MPLRLYREVSTVDKQLDKFKDFVREHPGLKTLVRNGDASWQSLFEEWYLYGDSDSQWEKYKKDSIEKKKTAEKEKSAKAKPAAKAKDKDKEKDKEESSSSINGTEMMTQALQYIQKMDMNKVQQTMGTVQQFIQIFQSMQGGKGGGSQGAQPKQTYPTLFSKFDD